MWQKENMGSTSRRINKVKEMKLKEDIDPYWYGLFVGFAGGLLGNLFITLWYRTADNPTYLNISLSLGSLVVLLIFASFLWRMAIPRRKKP